MIVRITSRSLSYFLCVAVLATLAALIPQAQAHASGNPDEVSASTTVYVPVVTPVVQSRPAEDDAAFNPCTMGVDGRFPESDVRHYTPGPCDLATVLPYGERFTVATAPVRDSAECVTKVTVVDASGQAVELAFAWWVRPCTANEDVTPLLRKAAKNA